MKNITIGGRLTKDAVLRRTGNSDPVLGFSVAVDHRDGQNKSTMYFDCSLWGKRGEALEQYLVKGGAVVVSGDLGAREHDGKTYMTVRANEVTMLGGGQREERQPERSSASRAMAQRPAMDDEMDSIPFAPEWR